MRGRFLAIGSLLLMAVETYVGLFRLQADRVGCCMHAMAPNTGGVVSLVHTACPGEGDVVRMAVLANRVLLIDRCLCTWTKIDNRPMIRPRRASS